MLNLIEDKKTLRKYALSKRTELDNLGETKRISSLIVKKISASSDFHNAKNIALYFPLKGEINLLPLLKIKGKKFYFPRCTDFDMFFCPYIQNRSLIKDKFGIMCPDTMPVNPNILDIIYLPSLYANLKGYRLGYGKGCYDSFFKKNKISAKKVIVIASEFISSAFVEEKHDVRCDEIFCEK